MTDRMIRPVSDLRNHFGDMVVLSMEAYEQLELESEICDKLAEAERETEATSKRYSMKDVLADMRREIEAAGV